MTKTKKILKRNVRRKKLTIRSRELRIRRKKPFYKKSGFWLAPLFFLVVGTGSGFLIFGKLFQAREITVTGQKTILTDEIKEIVNPLIRKKIVFNTSSIFLSSPLLIEKAVLNAFPQTKSVDVWRRFPDTIKMKITERDFFATFCFGNGSCYAADEEGIIFRAAGEEQKQPVINLGDIGEMRLGENAVKPEYLSNFSKIIGGLVKNPVFKTGAIFISDRKLEIQTQEGPKLYFDLEDEALVQTENLFLVLGRELAEQNLGKLEYIDLRFGNKVFYK